MELTTILFLAYINVVLIVLASVANSIMDTLNFRYETSKFSNIRKDSKLYWWFNTPLVTWKNKYKDRDINKGPAFFGSTTFLVFITDAWHFFQMIMLSCFQLMISSTITTLYSIITPTPTIEYLLITLCIFIVLKVIYGSVFELFWNYLWKSKS